MARYLFKCPLRWSDMDSYGHINNVQYLRLLEEARVSMLFVDAKAADVMTLEKQLVVVRHEIDYLAPLVYRPEPIDIELWTTRVGGASLTVAYEVKDETSLYARARTVLAAIDNGTGRARRLTPDERAWVENWIEPDPVG